MAIAGSTIDLRQVVGLDCESCLIRPGLPAPPVVCSAFYYPESGPRLYATADQWRPWLELFASDRLIVGHAISYDVCLALEWGPAELRQLIFDAYDADRVLDTMLAQRIVEIETGDVRGSLGLDRLCARYGLHVDKHVATEDGEEVRTNYGPLLNRPLADYSEEHRRYALNDPVVTWKLFERILARGLVRRADLAKFARADLALKITAAYGVVANPERVQLLEDTTRARLAELQALMLKQGLMRWVRGRDQPSRNVARIKAEVARAYGFAVDEKGMFAGDFEEMQALQQRGLLTDGGKTGRVGAATSKTVLAESGDEVLTQLAHYGELASVWGKDLKVFRWSASCGLPITTRFGFAATTRTTSGGGKQRPGWVPGMNLQNFAKSSGARECIGGRLGALVSSDYTGLENGTLAQVIVWTLGRRTMAEKISAGWNFHADVAHRIAGNANEPTWDEMRAIVTAKDAHHPEWKPRYNAAKPLNFGLPGYMTRPETVQSYAKIGYGVNLPVPRWRELIDIWYATQHDQVAYLREYVDGLRMGNERGATYNVPIPSTGIIRRGATRTAAANTGFQGLGAQVALDGLYRIVRAQVLGQMPGRACGFIHDEVISDCREDDVDAVRVGHEHHMLAAAESKMPDVRMAVESNAMRFWSKAGKTLYDSDGRLRIDEAC